MGLLSRALGLDDEGEAARADREAALLQKRLAEVGLAKQRKQTLAQARIERASLISKASATGGGSSSGLEGTLSSIQSQTGEVISFSGTQVAFGEAIFQAKDRAAKARSKAARKRAFGGLAIQAGQSIFAGS